MKKLSLNASVFQKGEVLTRSQLKKVLGGISGSGDCDDECGEDKACPTGKTCHILDDREKCGHYTQRCW